VRPVFRLDDAALAAQVLRVERSEAGVEVGLQNA